MFDTVIMIDWSAAAVPALGADSVWTAALDLDRGPDAIELVNHPTRHGAIAALEAALLARPTRRVLVGVDFALGFPKGFVDALGFASWRDVWRHLGEEVVDTAGNRNNRFAVAAALNARLGPGGPGPFWGCPAAQASETLTATKSFEFPYPLQGGSLAEYRATEVRLRTVGRRPMSVWQTHYAGSVGGQTIVGIAALSRFLDRSPTAMRCTCWPFEPTGPGNDDVVIAEVWPSLFPIDMSSHPVRDAAQVIGTVRHLAQLIEAGDVAAMLAVRDAGDEGWILGA
jgi:precorrin-8X/cobalt-precorrin-8 methylmutase